MDTDELAQIRKDPVNIHASRLLILPAQKAEVTAGNLDAIRHLEGDGLQAIIGELQIFSFEPAQIADALVDKLDETGNSGKGSTHIVDDAAVDLGARLRDLPFEFLGLQLAGQLLPFFLDRLDCALERRPRQRAWRRRRKAWLYSPGHRGVGPGAWCRAIRTRSSSPRQFLDRLLLIVPGPRGRTCPPGERRAPRHQWCCFEPAQSPWVRRRPAEHHIRL